MAGTAARLALFLVIVDLTIGRFMMTRLDLAGLVLAGIAALAAGGVQAEDGRPAEYPPYASRCLAGPLGDGIAATDGCRPMQARFGLAGPMASHPGGIDPDITGSIGPAQPPGKTIVLE